MGEAEVGEKGVDSGLDLGFTREEKAGGEGECFGDG